MTLPAKVGTQNIMLLYGLQVLAYVKPMICLSDEIWKVPNIKPKK